VTVHQQQNANFPRSADAAGPSVGTSLVAATIKEL